MKVRIEYQIEEARDLSISRKKGVTTLRVDIPNAWGMFSPEGNNILTQNAIQAVERLAILANHLSDPPTNKDAKNLKRKFKAYYNTILFLYYSGYHLLAELHYGQCSLRLPEEAEDFGEAGDTHVRDNVAEFGDLLIELICQIPLTEIEAEELMDWSNYYDLPPF